MEDNKRDKGCEKKMKYVRPALISLDKDKEAEGAGGCSPGSGAQDNCDAGVGAKKL